MVLPPSQRSEGSSSPPAIRDPNREPGREPGRDPSRPPTRLASRTASTVPPVPPVPPTPREEMPSIVAEGDRRLHRRARLDRPVLVETSARSGTARAIDVAAGGIALRTDLPLGPKDRVGIYFELPIGYAVETQAEVVRRVGDLVALRFIEAPREAIIAVRGFCRVSGLLPAVPAA